MCSARSFHKDNIPEYFSGKTVAITGATGFIGHSLVEKLLRSCAGVTKIYMFIRRKKNLTPQERLENLIMLPVRKKELSLSLLATSVLRQV